VFRIDVLLLSSKFEQTHSLPCGQKRPNLAPVGRCKPEHSNGDVIAENNNGRCKNLETFTFRRKTNQHRPAVTVATHCNIPLLLDHLPFTVTSQIYTPLGKRGSVWLFLNMQTEVSAIPALALSNCPCHVFNGQNTQTVLTRCSPHDGPLIPTGLTARLCGVWYRRLIVSVTMSGNGR